MTHLETTMAGEEVLLLPEGVLSWPREETLFVADLHVGKVASMRALGSPLPGGSTSADLRRLRDLIAQSGARRLIVLGDLYHARTGRVARMTAEAFAAWRNEHANVEVVLVPGNHDREAGFPDRDLHIEVVPQGHRVGPFALRHEPGTMRTAGDGFFLAGHIHPGALMRGPGGERQLLPCFWVMPGGAILPAFGSATGAHPIEPMADDRVFVVADGEVIAV